MLHWGAMRKYTLGLLSTFNDIEIEYTNSTNTGTISKKVPIAFSSREKSTMFSEADTKQILSGNYNVLPRISLVLSTIVKSDTRTTGKYNKVNSHITDDNIAYTYNPVAYDFTYELVILCRGMNEASMIIEQIAPRFNPNYTIRLNEVSNQGEATSVPVSLLDIGLETEEYEEFSTNLVTVSMGLALKGNMYPPLKNTPKIKNVEMYNNIWPEDEFQRTSLLEWDVVDKQMVNQEQTIFTELLAPSITDIVGSFVIGDSSLSVVFEDKDNKDSELIFVWNVVSGDATIGTGSDTVTLTVNSGTTCTVSCLITDVHGNSSGVFEKIL